MQKEDSYSGCEMSEMRHGVPCQKNPQIKQRALIFTRALQTY